METSQKPPFKKENPSLAPAIRPLIFAVIACGLTVLLFSPAGIIYKHLDLSFLVLPLLSYFILRLVSRLSTIYITGYVSPMAGNMVSGICTGLAFTLLFYFFFGNVDRLANTGIFRYIDGFLNSLATAASYIAIFIIGITVSRTAEIYRRDSTGNALYPGINAIGQILTGIGIWRFLTVVSGNSDAFNKMGAVIFAGIIAIAIANAGHYGVKSKNPFIADASHWLTHSHTAEFLIGAFIATYILVIRPLIEDAFRYAIIIEWLIVCFLGWRLFSGIKNGIRTRCAVNVYETDWQKHVQLISNLQGTDFPRLREIQESFAEDGSRDTLLIYLTLTLHNNKIPAEEITRILHPLINHRDEKMPWFAFGWEQRRVLKRNENRRRAVLGEIMANLKYIMNPANQTIEENNYEQK